MRRLCFGVGVLFAAACNLHLDPSLIDAADGTEGDLTEEGGTTPPTTKKDAGTKPSSQTHSDGGTDARVDAGDAGSTEDPPNLLCPAGATREKEPNDTLQTATPSPVGTICGRLEANDQDFFTFTVGPDGLLRVSFDAESDARMILSNEKQTTIFNSGSPARQAFNTDPNSNWQIRIVSNSDTPQGYTITR